MERYKQQKGQHPEAMSLIDFIEKSNGLNVKCLEEDRLVIQQATDLKTCLVDLDMIEKVMFRTDNDGQQFIQVNFMDNRKILVTDALIGFRPQARRGIDLDKLPRVVTTPDLVSVIEALEDTINATTEYSQEEAEVLKELFHSVIDGAEMVGFELSEERAWLKRLYSASAAASA